MKLILFLCCQTISLFLIGQDSINKKTKAFRWVNNIGVEGSLLINESNISGGGSECSLDFATFKMDRLEIGINSGYFLKLKFTEKLDPMYIGFQPKTLTYSYIPLGISGSYHLFAKREILLKASVGIPFFVREGSNSIGKFGFWASYSDALLPVVDFRKKIYCVIKLQFLFPLSPKFNFSLGTKAFVYDSHFEKSKIIFGLNFGLCYKFKR